MEEALTIRGLTVGKLKELLAAVPDAVPIALQLEPGAAPQDLASIHQLALEYNGGPLVILRPTRSEWRVQGIEEHFEITGRGLAVPLSEENWPYVIPFTAVEYEIEGPAGQIRSGWAGVELLLRSGKETPALLMNSLSANEIEQGSILRFRGAA
ncbi:MAG TPA: hypothetical protein VEL74_04185 [Thermoanaerobaculia bacterium]|nr:hypothetical protein [Thermoanaerobaculia bacterium]